MIKLVAHPPQAPPPEFGCTQFPPTPPNLVKFPIGHSSPGILTRGDFDRYEHFQQCPAPFFLFRTDFLLLSLKLRTSSETHYPLPFKFFPVFRTWSPHLLLQNARSLLLVLCVSDLPPHEFLLRFQKTKNWLNLTRWTFSCPGFPTIFFFGLFFFFHRLFLLSYLRSNRTSFFIRESWLTLNPSDPPSLSNLFPLLSLNKKGVWVFFSLPSDSLSRLLLVIPSTPWLCGFSQSRWFKTLIAVFFWPPPLPPCFLSTLATGSQD